LAESIAPGDRQTKGVQMISQKHSLKAGVAVALATSALGPAGAAATLPAPDPPQPATPTRVELVRVSSNAGFDWGDAGIGAAAAVGLSMLAAGGIALTQRRGRHGSSAATS
jgi:hypothetical protein